MFERFGRADEIEEEPELPHCISHVADWFFDLSQRRAPAMSGVSPLMDRDIDAWVRLNQIDITPDEVRMLYACDNAYRRALSESAKPKEDNPQALLRGRK